MLPLPPTPPWAPATTKVTLVTPAGTVQVEDPVELAVQVTVPA